MYLYIYLTSNTINRYYVPFTDANLRPRTLKDRQVASQWISETTRGVWRSEWMDHRRAKHLGLSPAGNGRPWEAVKSGTLIMKRE